MRVSSYTIGTPLPGQPFYLLMHGFTGAVDKLSASLGGFLVGQRGCELQPDDPAIAGVSAVTLSQLKSRGYLTDLDPESERQLLLGIARRLHEADLAGSQSGFMFVPTYTCNLRCPYCFQSHEMHSGRGHYCTTMTRARVDEAFSVIDRLTLPGAFAKAAGMIEGSDADSLSEPVPLQPITLFGGEPLSRVSLPIVPYILEQAVKRRTTLSAITNGVELDAFADLLGPGQIETLQITLDGVAALHDRRRIGPQFHQTFDTICDNIQMALERDVYVSVRVNVDSTNKDSLGELNLHMQRKGWFRNPRFKAYGAAVYPEGSSSRIISRAELVETIAQLRHSEDCQFEDYGTWARDTLRRSLFGPGYPFQRVANCAAESGLLIFDPLGDVYSCWEEVGQREFRLGTYDAGGLEFVGTTAQQWLNRFVGTIDQCSACPYALIHTAGCASHARKAGGTMFSSACESFQEYFPRTLAREYLSLEQAVLDGGERRSEVRAS